MLKLTNKTSLIIALILATVVSFFIYQYVSSETAAAQKNSVPVVVAALDVPVNTVITGDMVSVKNIPEDYAHEQACRDTGEVVGEVSKVPLLSGEQVLTNKIASKGDKGNRFSYNIPDKHRALTVAVNEVTGVGGFPTVGDRVDIMLTTGEGTNASTKTFMQNKEILATGGIISSQEDGQQRVVPTLTLCVTPEEAQQLTFAESRGSVKYILRPPEDKENVNLEPVSS